MNRTDPDVPFCSTSGKIPLQSVADGGPDLWHHGHGAWFWDVAGRAWLDFDLCLGSVVWGHARDEIAAAVTAQLLAGGAPTVPSALEQRAAETLLLRLSRYETVRFFKTGAEACTAAIRFCRLATRRPRIVSDGFHGWHDWAIGGAYPGTQWDVGVPAAVQELTITLDPTQGLDVALATLQANGRELAAAIFRPEAWDGPALRTLITAARQAGAFSICDEVTSHLKYSKLGSAAEKKAEPDMICIGKGLANGMPLAAVAGPRFLLDRIEARTSSTNSSETWSLAAMLAAEQLLNRAPLWPSWRRNLDSVTSNLSAKLTDERLDTFRIESHPGFFSIQRHGVTFGTDPFRRHLVVELAKASIYTRGWFHGSDMHAASDWEHLEASLIGALRTWKAT